MELLVIGCNFKTSAIGFRENWNVPPEQISSFCRGLLQIAGVSGVVYLPTCNRVELYVTLQKEVPLESIFSYWRQFLKLEGPGGTPGYIYKNDLAFSHLVKVCSGLDSLVVGEPQVLGQVKQAYSQSVEMGVASSLTNFVFQQAFRYAKQVRTETGVAKYPVSIASVALMLAFDVFGDFSNLSALVVGLGEMGKQTAELLIKRGIGNLTVINRTYERAVQFAEKFSAKVHRFETFAECLSEADLVLTSTSSLSPVLTSEMFCHEGVKEKKKPMVLIDLGVPRDIDPDVANLQNLFLYNIDDLKTIADKNLSLRMEEAQLAEDMIAKSVEVFNVDWQKRSKRSKSALITSGFVFEEPTH